MPSSAVRPNRPTILANSAGSSAPAVGPDRCSSALRGSQRAQDGVAAPSDDRELSNPLAPRSSHFAPRAKACIFIFLEGAPSQLDLYDPKPKLNELNGQPLPESLTKNVRFAFIKKEGAVLMGSPRKWTKHGECGMDFSDFLPLIQSPGHRSNEHRKR